MLKKLTSKHREQKKNLLLERTAKACYNLCAVECDMDPDIDRVTMNFDINIFM